MTSYTETTVTMGTDAAPVSYPVTWTFPRGGYREEQRGQIAVYGHITMDVDGAPVDMPLDVAPDAPGYSEAFDAARAAYKTARAARRAQIDAEKAARAANPDKQAHGAVPDKTWQGTSIWGAYPGATAAKQRRVWCIDCDAEQIAVSFPGSGRPAAWLLDAVKAAGFHWSPARAAWCKKSTWKGYRAALALAIEYSKAGQDKRNGRQIGTFFNHFAHYVTPAQLADMLTAAKQHAAA